MNSYKISILLLLLALISVSCQNQPAEQNPSKIPIVTAIPTSEKIQNTETSPVSTTEIPLPTVSPTVIEATSQNNLPVQFPDATQYSWEKFVSGLNKPLGLAAISDDSGRLLILEQEGVIRLIENAELKETPFLDIRDRINIQGSEQGLLGIALAPDFIDSRIFYLNYTDLKGDTVIARYQAAVDLNTADHDSEQNSIKSKTALPQP